MNYRIVLYGTLLLIVVIFEEPRVSELLKTVFREDDFRPFFSFAIPILFLSGVIFSERKWVRLALNIAFFALLFLSYWNTIRVSYNDLVNSRNSQLQSIEAKISEKSVFLLSDPDLKTCYSPQKNSENFDDQYNYYRYCLSENEKIKSTLFEKKSIIQSEYDSLVLDLKNLKSTPIDLSLPITQGLTGFILSVILGTVGSIFAKKITIEFEHSESTREEQIAILIAKGLSAGEISSQLDIPKSTVYRKYNLIRSKKPNSHRGKKWENVRKSGNLVGKQWETEIPDEILVGGQS